MSQSAPKTAIVTGASEGIGASIARSLAKRGYELGLLARRREMLEAVAEECRKLGSPRVEIASVDVTHSEQLRNSLQTLDDQFGGVSIFVANAGIGGEFRPNQDAGPQIRKMFEVNVIGAIDGIEFMKAKMTARRRGTLSAVASVAGARGLPLAGAYSATKAALSVYLEGLRIDVKAWNVRVVDISPGFIDTAMTRSNKAPKPFMIDSGRAAEIFVSDLLKGKPRSIAPWQMRPVYTFLKLIPDWIYAWGGARSVKGLSQKLFEKEKKLLKNS